MFKGRLGKTISVKVPLLPRKPSHEKVKRYGGIRNGRNKRNLKNFLCDKFEHSIRRASIRPTIPDNTETENPINSVLKKTRIILESNEKSTKFQKE